MKPANNRPSGGKPDNFDERVDRCLSMVMHYEEMEQIADIIKRLHHEKYDIKEQLPGG